MKGLLLQSYIVAFHYKSSIQFEKMILHKCIGRQIWPYSKQVKGEPRIIIWINLVDLSWTLYIRIHLQAFLVLEKICKWFVPYMGMAAILIKRPWPTEQTLNHPLTESFIWNLVNTGPVVLEEAI